MRRSGDGSSGSRTASPSRIFARASRSLTATACWSSTTAGPRTASASQCSLCALRFLGFVPDDIGSIPDEALVFVAGQVDAGPHELLPYGARAQTRSDHLQLVLGHLDWRRADDEDRERLAQWLVERAVEQDVPAALMALVGEHLRARRIIRPPVDALARMIATVRQIEEVHVTPEFFADL